MVRLVCVCGGGGMKVVKGGGVGLYYTFITNVTRSLIVIINYYFTLGTKSLNVNNCDSIFKLLQTEQKH